jgi:hypothetical protein
MKLNVGVKRPNSIPKLAITAAFSAMLASPVIYANPSNRIVLVPPMNLPTLAQQSGEAMFLHDTWDGRTLLYVEPRQGAQLAIFDVTDPAHVKGEGAAQLNAAGPFDFVAALGQRAELVRFRQGQGDAVLDLSKVPTLKKVLGLQTQTSTVAAANGGSELAAPAVNPAMDQSVQDYRVLESGKSQADDHIVEVKQVRQEMTNAGTGTTFLLAEKGLFLIRRPALETAPEVYLNTGG